MFDAEALKAHRRRVGWSQTMLAERAGISRSYVAELETGAKSDPSMLVLRALSHTLRVQVGDLQVEDPVAF